MAEITKREQLIFDIASAEWELFQLVYNTGGRASCQDDPDTFFKMRMSQWMVYSDGVLESYMDDLQTSAQQGRNLVFEKYAHMMETTFPEEYVQIKEHLPAVSERKLELIERAARIHVDWDAYMAEHYPNLRGNGRVLRRSQDSVYNGSSSESYLRGEMMTYSDRTLELMVKEITEADARGENLLKQIIANETAFYGYKSLEDAEAAHA